MKNLYKVTLFFTLLLLCLGFNMISSKAATTTANNEESLKTAITNATTGDIIELGTDITLTSPISVTGKEITIDGNGHTVTRNAENWTPDGSNGTLITASLNDTKLTLMNMKLTNSQKYGAQSYDGAYLVLDGVTISNCGYGGVLVNAGTVEVKNLILNKNGTPNNNGIEIAKGNGIYTETNKPILIMNGTLSSTETENVIYLAVNDQLSSFETRNTDTTVNKIYTSGSKVIVTDENNNVLFESNENANVPITGEPFVKNVTVTIKLMDKTVTTTLKEGDTLTEENAKSKINLADLGLSNYTLDGFYSDEETKTAFDFSKPITDDTTIYTKLTEKAPEPEPAKDTTPKTGVEDNIGIAITLIALSAVAIILVKKKIS